ncbi:hypothetical protein ACIREE_29930 [Streptomyces sp. NPDC102467]|uniref:hypothetical protein n=1 Tax=Streptomyces sp. NPDC102467 TaxID=3366179 RepID=UPI00382E2498
MEKRLAKANHLKVGDRIKLKAGELPGPGQEKNETEHSFEVVGIYTSGTADAGQYVPPVMDSANRRARHARPGHPRPAADSALHPDEGELTCPTTPSSNSPV